MPRRLAKFIVVVLSVLGLVCASDVRAADKGGEGRNVSITTVGQPAGAARLPEVLFELLARLGVKADIQSAATLDLRVVLTPRSEPPERVANAWIDLRAQDTARLYVVDRTWERVLVRDVPMEHGVDEVVREEIGHILEAAVETLLAGGSIGRPREEVSAELGLIEPARPAPSRPEPPAPPPRPEPLAPSARADRALEVAGFWALRGYSDDALLTHGPGLWGALVFRSAPLSPSVRALAQYHFPLTDSEDAVSLRLDTLTTRLFGAIEQPIARDVHVTAALGAGVDFVHVYPHDPGPTTTAGETRWTLVPFWSAMIGVRARLAGPLALESGLTLDTSFSDVHYFVTRAGSEHGVLDPWSVQPGLMVALVAMAPTSFFHEP